MLRNVVQNRLAGAAGIRPGLAGLIHSGSLLPTSRPADGAEPCESLFSAFLGILVSGALHSRMDCVSVAIHTTVLACNCTYRVFKSVLRSTHPSSFLGSFRWGTLWVDRDLRVVKFDLNIICIDFYMQSPLSFKRLAYRFPTVKVVITIF